MATEIERKFLPRNDAWRAHAKNAVTITQGYLNTDPNRTVRVRHQQWMGLNGTVLAVGYITVKGKTQGVSRSEYEYKIPSEDAQQMLETFAKGTVISKTRSYVYSNCGKFVFEIDEFHGANEGLVVIEIELESEDSKYPIPDWLGPEVSDDARYFNSNLLTHPYTKWAEVWHKLGDDDTQ